MRGSADICSVPRQTVLHLAARRGWDGGASYLVNVARVSFSFHALFFFEQIFNALEAAAGVWVRLKLAVAAPTLDMTREEIVS